MSVQIIQSKCVLVLTCLLGQIMLFAAPAQAQLAGTSYNVNASSSLGNQFTACFQFDANGILYFLGQNATYSVSSDQTSWQAVTIPSSPPSVSVSLKGVVQGGVVQAQTINGTAINSNGTTFTFNGTLLSQSTCPAQQPISPADLQYGMIRGNGFLQ